MKLYKKIVLISLSIFVSLSLILYLLSRQILLMDFVKIENETIVESMKKVKNKVDEQFSKLDNLALEYSMWDDTYDFMENSNEQYIQSNFSNMSTFKEFNINFILFIDNNKKIKMSKWFNLKNSEEEKSDLDIERYLVEKINGRRIKGIINTKRGPIFIVSQDITNTNGDKKARGTIIVGRYLDNEQMSEFQKQLRLNLNYSIYNKDSIIRSEVWKGNIGIKEISSKQKQGSLILKDIDNKPYIVMNVLMERNIYNSFIRSVNWFLTVVILVAIIVTFIFFYEIYRLITKRILNISNTINKISKTKELSFTVDEKGNDEITILSRSFNQMIGILQKYKKSIIFNEKKYRSLFSNMTNGCCYNKLILDKNGKAVDFVILEANEEFEKIFNMPKKEIIGNKVTNLLEFNKRNADLIKEFYKIAVNKEKKIFEPIYSDKIKKWIFVSAYSIENDYFAIMVTDITEKKKAQQKIIQLAHYDSLTGLPNRKLLIESIRSTIYNKIKSAILFIDLDNFKDINDTLGHDVGDKVLEKVAYLLKGVIPKGDVIGRIGGDEFVILQKNIDSINDSKELALRISNILKTPIKCEDKELYIGASIGISIYPQDANDVRSLMKNADIAMYEAKRKGEHLYEVYSKNMKNKIVDKVTLENNLLKSITKKEIVVFYQPIVEILKMKIIGFEALIRWMHNGILVNPADFIPICEQTGFIVELGEWVLRESCKQWRKWYDKNICVYLSVNITFKQIQSPNFVETVKSSIKDAKMDYKYLILEITENGTMQNPELAIKVLNELKSLGIQIALDDFGTGYSSLSQVNKLPVDVIKIDRSLTFNIEKDNENLQILKSIIGMSHSLNIKVIIEGVETNEQLELLKKINCDSIQGYLISKPVSVEQAEKLYIK